MWAFDWVVGIKEVDSDEEPDTLVMIDTPVYLQFIIFCSLQRLKVGHFGVAKKGQKLSTILLCSRAIGFCNPGPSGGGWWGLVRPRLALSRGGWWGAWALA